MENGQMVVPANLTTEELELLKKQRLFFCPHCRNSVVFKRGTRKIPHFAHRQNSDCASFSEGETEQHLNGKLQLYEVFNRITDQVVLEGYIADIQQRPDLLLSSDQKQYAIEFQCSTIPISQVTSRNDGYHAKSITPIWILLSPAWKTGTIITKLTNFQHFFISSNSIITYNPSSKSFYYLSNLLHIQSTTYIAKVDKLTGHSQTWPLATVKKISFTEFQDYLALYEKKRANHLHNLYYFNKKGVQNYFLRICYYHGVQPATLPQFIGIPTRYANVFSEHACEWQLAWLDYLTAHRLTLRTVTKKHCILFIRGFNGNQGELDKKVNAIQSYSSLLNDTLIEVGGNFLSWNINNWEMKNLLYSHFIADE